MRLSKKSKSFSIIELIVVTVIIGILATLSIAYFGPLKEKTLDREAQANLKLIQAAQKIYNLENYFYYPHSSYVLPVGTGDVNSSLRLDLPIGAKRSWDYTTKSTGCGKAIRTDPSARTWMLQVTDEDATGNADCP